MAREVMWLQRDEFWETIEVCRQSTPSCESFADALPTHLQHWDFPKLGAFHNTMWYDVRVFHRGELWDVMYRYEEMLGNQNAWECYGGWLISQGREFFEAVMANPQLALSRIPTWEEIDAGERIIFAAVEACLRKTDREYGLDDMLGDFQPDD